MNVEMYCSNCGTVGKPESYTPGKFGMEVVLCSFLSSPA